MDGRFNGPISVTGTGNDLRSDSMFSSNLSALFCSEGTDMTYMLNPFVRNKSNSEAMVIASSSNQKITKFKPKLPHAKSANVQFFLLLFQPLFDVEMQKYR